MDTRRRDYLKRLPAEYYRGRAYVHWSLTIENRRTGWLIPTFYYKFREVLAHTMFRYGLCCPIFCCMTDHIHLLWVGILDSCDQRKAMRFFRKKMNPVLQKLEVKFQLQSYDHVLRDSEREPGAFEEVAGYIARNPERKNLVPADGFSLYPFTGCLVPGYPEVSPFETGYWERFWNLYSYMVKNGLQVG